MGIYGAMTTAISGIRAQSFALEQISGNIANSQTTGFKRNETSFVDLVSEAASQRQISGSTDAFSRSTNTVSGDITNSSVETHMAIAGDGYFMVERANGYADGSPVLSGVDLYTRRGDFELDRNGYLINGGGYYLQGLTLDPVTGNPTGSVPEAIQVRNDFIPASGTTAINYRANLATFPLTSEANQAVPGSELLNGPFNNDPTTANAAADQYVEYSDVDTFLGQSISGGAITVYDESGAPANVQLRWAKTDSSSTGGTDTWNLFYMEDGNTTTSTDPVWRNVGTDFDFATNGQLTAPTGNVTIAGLNVNGIDFGDVTLNTGSNGLTSFADTNGVARVNEINQNGFPAGELLGVSLGEDGQIIASYSNGETLSIAQVVLASFNGDNALKKLDGGAFQETAESGPASVGATGTISGQSLEGSNTDIADEFTKLITTQQAYAAGTRIITTSDEMLQEIINMVR